MNEQELITRSIQLLESIKQLNRTHNPITDINLFSILGMETKEVSAHSAFLYYIFKPFENGDKKDDYNLRILYNYLKDMKSDLPENPINLNIYREKAFDNGRIDFLIKYDNDAIVVELKVYAGEQEDQIKRYQDYLRENNYTEDNVFFLTPEGRQSKTGESIPISLTDLCSNVLKKISKKRDNKDYTTIIDQYCSIIGKITGNGDNKYMEFSEVIKNRDDILAVDKLFIAKKKQLTIIIKSFMEKLKSELLNQIKSDSTVFLNLYEPSKDVPHLNIDNYYEVGRGKGSWPAIIFEVADNEEIINKYNLKAGCDKDNDNEIVFYAEVENYLFCGLTLRKEKVYSQELQGDFQKDSLNNMRFFSSYSWLCWEPVLLNGERINFNDYLNESESALRLLKQDSLIVDDDAIKQIAETIIADFKKQYVETINRLK